MLDIASDVATVVALLLAAWALVITYSHRGQAQKAAAHERRAVFELTVLRELLNLAVGSHYHAGSNPTVKALLGALPHDELPRLRVCSQADDEGASAKAALMAHLDAEGYPTAGLPERRAMLAIADEIRRSMVKRADE